MQAVYVPKANFRLTKYIQKYSGLRPGSPCHV